MDIPISLVIDVSLDVVCESGYSGFDETMFIAGSMHTLMLQHACHCMSWRAVSNSNAKIEGESVGELANLPVLFPLRYVLIAFAHSWWCSQPRGTPSHSSEQLCLVEHAVELRQEHADDLLQQVFLHSMVCPTRNREL